MLSAREWEELEAGLRQRARALNAFVRDAYSEQRIVRNGVVPARLIETSENLEPEMVGVEVQGPSAPVIGFDVVRGEDGRFRILEDNCLNPSGIAYALAARTAIDTFVPLQPPAERRDIAYAVELLRQVLAAASPDGDPEAPTALISEGEENGAWYEHVALAERLGIPIVDPDDLEVRGGRLYGAPTGERPSELRVIYLRDNVGAAPRRERRPDLAARAARAGQPREPEHRERLRLGSRGRQAHPRLLRGDDPLLPRRGADHPDRPHL